MSWQRSGGYGQPDRALPCLSLEQATTSLSGYHHIVKQEK